MKARIITIFYEPNEESGPAELIGNRLARVLCQPIFNEEVFVGDIVRLSHTPHPEELFPTIIEVVSARFPMRTELWVSDDEEFLLLRSLFALLDAESHYLLPPCECGGRGVMIVGHTEDIDPVLLAEAVGIDQSEDDEEAEDVESPTGRMVELVLARPRSADDTTTQPKEEATKE